MYLYKFSLIIWVLFSFHGRCISGSSQTIARRHHCKPYLLKYYCVFLSLTLSCSLSVLLAAFFTVCDEFFFFIVIWNFQHMKMRHQKRVALFWQLHPFWSRHTLNWIFSKRVNSLTVPVDGLVRWTKATAWKITLNLIMVSEIWSQTLSKNNRHAYSLINATTNTHTLGTLE